MKKEHPIRRYVKRLGITVSDFARELGCSPQHISKITLDPSCRPSPKLAHEIMVKTGGQISYADLYSWEPPKTKGAG